MASYCLGLMELFTLFCCNIVVNHPAPLLSGPACLVLINLIMRKNIACCMLYEVIRGKYLRYVIPWFVKAYHCY